MTSGIDEGAEPWDAVTVKAPRFVPSSDSNELYVQVLTGKMVGTKGWMLTSIGATADGNPVGTFDEMAAAANGR